MPLTKEIYVDTAIKFVRGIFLIASAFALVWTILACVDVTAGFHWGYALLMIPVGLGAAVFAYCGNLVVKKIGIVIKEVGRD